MRAEGAIKDDRTGTRAKILDACRALFNERGPAEVTTAEIAQAVGISEGNLHYHFRRKQQILVALFDEFEAALDDVAASWRGRSASPWNSEVTTPWMKSASEAVRPSSPYGPV